MKKSIWIIGAAVLVIVLGSFTISGALTGGQAKPVNYIELYPSELINSISIKGVVESAEKTNVYSTLGFPVKDVRVEAGDMVAEGQILCVLNTEELENNIAQQRAQLNAARQNNNSQIQITFLNLESARKKYNDALRDSENATMIDLDFKKTAYINNMELFKLGYISETDLVQSELAYTNALNNYTGTLEQTRDALRTAQINYENAIAANTLSQELGIEKMEKQLSDSAIRATASGTVTAVYAKTGTVGSGLLFVIEDTDNLVIKTTIKEYDISSVRTGMNVIIKSDSTGSAVYEGIVSKIAPAAIKDSYGETALRSDVEFEAQVTIISRNTDLRIGMNTRLNIILERKDGVFSVPYDAIITNANGENYIFSPAVNGQNRQIAMQLSVTIGIESDFYVEISGGDLFNGIKVISDASAINDGMQINTGTGGAVRGQRN